MRGGSSIECLHLGPAQHRPQGFERVEALPAVSRFDTLQVGQEPVFKRREQRPIRHVRQVRSARADELDPRPEPRRRTIEPQAEIAHPLAHGAGDRIGRGIAPRPVAEGKRAQLLLPPRQNAPVAF